MWKKPINFDKNRDRVMKIEPSKLLKMRSKPPKNLNKIQRKKYKNKYNVPEHGGRGYISKLSNAIKDKNQKVPMLIVYESEIKQNKIYQGRHRGIATQRLGKKIPIIIRKSLKKKIKKRR